MIKSYILAVVQNPTPGNGKFGIIIIAGVIVIGILLASSVLKNKK